MREVIRHGIRHKKLLLTFSLVGVVLAFVFMYYIPERYTATGFVQIGQMKSLSGDVWYLQDSERIVDDVNHSLVALFPHIGAMRVSDDLVKVYSYSSNKEIAQKDVLEAMYQVVKNDTLTTAKIQSQIDKLSADKEGLRYQGQQIQNIYLRIFDLQTQLDAVTLTKPLGDVIVKTNALQPLLMVILGCIFGAMLGVLYIVLKSQIGKI